MDSYLLAAGQVAEHARKTGARTLHRWLIEDYLAGLHDRLAPATVAQWFRSLQQLCKWLTAEGELDADPMAGMSPPSVPAQPVAVLTPEQLKGLLKTCQGTGSQLPRNARHPSERAAPTRRVGAAVLHELSVEAGMAGDPQGAGAGRSTG